MNRLTKILLILLLPLTFLYSQKNVKSNVTYTSKNKKAINFYKQGENFFVQRLFVDAEQLLLQSVDKDSKFAEPYFLLGLMYKFQYNPTKSKAAFEKGLSLQPDNALFCNNYFSLAELYLREGNYDETEKLIKKYLTFPKENTQYRRASEQLLENCKFAREAMKTPLKFSPKMLPLTVNSNTHQYFPSVTADGNTLIYTSSYSFSMSGNEDLLVTTRKDTSWTIPTSISPKINSRENEGTASISGDGKTLVFTACGRRDSKGNCDLYVSYKTGNEWTTPVNMGGTINSNEWDSQPSLSADGRTLYFVSMRRGGLGEADIYISKKSSSDEWSTPQNLGPNINTVENESAPFIHSSGTVLYFSSNGRESMGGMDIFKSEFKDNTWAKATNLGFPINSSKDDQGLVLDADFIKGYYNSELIHNGKVFTMLYEFDVPTELKGPTHLSIAKGTVSDAVSHKKLGSKIELIDLSTGSVVSSITSDEINGDFTLILNEGKEYALYCSRKGYLFKSMSFNYEKKVDFNPFTLDIELEPIKKGSKITLNNIFFESGKYELQGKSTTELNRLIDFMHGNPNVKVEVSGHTDNVGNIDANMKLSTARAKAVFDFLTQNGVKTESITCKGYGSTKPVANNTTEEGKQLNRRIEFTIID